MIADCFCHIVCARIIKIDHDDPMCNLILYNFLTNGGWTTMTAHPAAATTYIGI